MFKVYYFNESFNLLTSLTSSHSQVWMCEFIQLVPIVGSVRIRNLHFELPLLPTTTRIKNKFIRENENKKQNFTFTNI